MYFKFSNFAFFQGSGIRGALRLLGWLQILPAEVACTEKLLESSPSSARLSSSGDMKMHLEGVADLERRLCYKFRDRSFLLQAITHASYTSNRITDCYQRLEFLGDAVLGTATQTLMSDLHLSNNTRFEVLITVLCDVTLCHGVSASQHFKGSWLLHLQDQTRRVLDP